MEKEKDSSIKQVVGVSANEKSAAMSHFEDKFENQSTYRYEKEKTPEEIAIISLVDQATNDTMQKYGWENIHIPAENVHIIDYKKWEDAYGEARYLNFDQAITIQEQPYRVLFAKKLFHEMIHFKSYNAVQAVNEKTPYPEDYRKGLVIFSRDGKKIYLNNLNEAIVEKITKMNINGLLKNPVFDDEIKSYNKIKTANIDMKSYSGLTLFDNETYFAEIIDNRSKGLKSILPRLRQEEQVHAIRFTYKEERLILDTLIGKIEQKKSDNHTNTDEIFEIFAKAAITDNILPMARLIENTFGHGTLRHIGELDDNIDEQKRFIESL